MNRRGFLSLLGGVFAAGALNEVIPFGRVWSFPSKITVPTLTIEEFTEAYIEPAVESLLTTSMITEEALKALQKHMKFYQYGMAEFDRPFLDSFKEAA